MADLVDLYHTWGSDLSTSATGDLLSVSGSTLGQQRVLRRLMTNPGEMLFQPTYGAGIGRFVGQVTDIPKIRAAIRGQMLLEDAVARSPAPTITAQAIPNGVFVDIAYFDRQTGAPVALRFSVTN